MTRTDLVEAAERILRPIQQFSRGWMLERSTADYGVSLGLRTGEEYWIVGRGGALGDVDHRIAAAALAFIAPDAVREAWEHVPPGMTPGQVARTYAKRCTDWGTDTLAAFDPARMERLDRLGRRIVDGASPALGALFTAWRSVPEPGDVGGRAALTMQVLREMRGAAHIIAIQACGLTPVDAILASPAPAPRTGVPWAEHLGFRGPFRDPDEVRPARLEAERVTTEIIAAHLGVLSPDELTDFAELVETTRNSIDM
ncbi:MAG: helix-turn-helix domain-containing protein [Actinomycetota bacterium]